MTIGEADLKGRPIFNAPLLLTNASSVLSGDHDGTLIVPWPP